VLRSCFCDGAAITPYNFAPPFTIQLASSPIPMSDGAARGDGECSETCTKVPLSDQARISVCKRMRSRGHGCVPDQVCEC